MPRLRATLRPRDFQDPRDPAKLLAEKHRPAIRQAVSEALKHLRTLVPVRSMADTIRRGELRRTAAAVPYQHFDEVLKSVFGKIAELRHEASDMGARDITAAFRRARKPVRFRKAFNPDEPRDEHGRWSGGGRETIETAETAARSGAFHENISRLEIVHDRSAGRIRPYELWAVYDHGTRVSLAAYRTEEEAKSSRWWGRYAKAIGDGFDFDRFDEATMQALRDAQNEMIRDLSDQTRDTVAYMIDRGVKAGDSAEEIAASIRDTISLTERQAQAVANYRRLLEDLDQSALDRALRNADLDEQVQDAIDSGTFLPDKVIDSLVEDYADNYLDYRAQTIAQTESVRASNEGLRDSYRQAADRGVFPAEAVRRFWKLGDRPCPVCKQIAENNPDGVGLNEDFQSDNGPVDDGPVHTSCYCTVEYVTNLDMLPDEAPADSETEDAA